MTKRQQKGIIAAGHALTGQAAEHILREGGNAFDAALAALAAACVAEPLLASLGGGGFLLAKPAQAPARLYDFFGQTPRQHRREDEIDFQSVLVDFGAATQEFHIGRGSIAVPGVVQGLFEVHRDLASTPMVELMAPAIEYANQGVEINRFHAYTAGLLKGILSATPEVARLFASPEREGELAAEGESLKQAELADALDVLSREGAELFYRGEIGQTFVQDMQHGGHITAEDLESYAVERRAPLTFDYGDLRLLTNPAPASGGLLIAFAMQLLEPERNQRPEFGSPEHLIRWASVMDLTSSARLDAAIDSRVTDRAAAQLLDPEYLKIWHERLAKHPRSTRGTTHISIIDAQLNVASVSVSNGDGSAYVIPDTGISVNNMLGEQDLNPSGVARWPTDERLTSMMAPSVGIYRDGGVLCTGSGGSNRIRSAILQVLVNLLDYDMPCEEAIYAPRVHYESGVLSLERGFDEERIAEVLEAFPDHQLFEELNMFFGGAHTVTARGDQFSGTGDPRRSGISILV